MEALLLDLRFALRALRKNPGFAAVAIITLALGIGANSAIFSVVNGILLRPLPYHQPGRLMTIWDSQKALAQAPSSGIEFLAYREQNTTFEQMAAVRARNLTMTGSGAPERVRGTIANANYFAMLGIAPVVGRNFTADDDKPGAARVAFVAYRYWQSRFGGDPAIVGRNLTLDGENVTVIGVLPADFVSPLHTTDFYLNSIYGVPELFSGYGDPRKKPFPHYLDIIGRLKAGVSPAQAQQDLGRIIAKLGAEQPASKDHGVALLSLAQRTIGDVRPTLFVLAGVVGLVLLIACANVANLLLARSTARQREIAVRAALGATGGRLARQMITEGAALGFLGGIAGLPLAYAGVRAIVAAKPEGLPRIDAIRLDAPVLLFTFAIALATGVLFGLAPALRGMRIAPGESLKQAGRSGGGSARQSWLRNALVVAEVALSLVLLIGAGLLTRSFVRLLEVRPGFQPMRLLTFWISFDGTKYAGSSGAAKIVGIIDPVHRMEAIPGIEAVAGSNDLPLNGQDTNSYPVIEGASAIGPDEKILVGMHSVTPGYLRAMGIPLLRGRDIAGGDVAGRPHVVVINQAFAERAWPGQDPIGKRVRLFNGASGAPEEVIGIAGNVKQNGLNAADSLEAYAPFAQEPWPYMAIALRTSLPEASALRDVRAILHDFDPDMPVFNVEPFEQVLSESLGSRRLTLDLTGLFAALALLLASIGIYGVMSYAVAARTQEIGIRMALGAERGQVLSLIVGHGMALAGAGLLLGAIGAALVARFAGSLLFGVRPYDPLTYAGVSVLLACVALLASYVPARRAMRVDPLVALREE